MKTDWSIPTLVLQFLPSCRLRNHVGVLDILCAPTTKRWNKFLEAHSSGIIKEYLEGYELPNMASGAHYAVTLCWWLLSEPFALGRKGACSEFHLAINFSMLGLPNGSKRWILYACFFNYSKPRRVIDFSRKGTSKSRSQRENIARWGLNCFHVRSSVKSWTFGAGNQHASFLKSHLHFTKAIRCTPWNLATMEIADTNGSRERVSRSSVSMAHVPGRPRVFVTFHVCVHNEAKFHHERTGLRDEKDQG